MDEKWHLKLNEYMKLTKPQKKALESIKIKSKGWPVGIPVHKKTAYCLVNMGLAEWAQQRIIN